MSSRARNVLLIGIAVAALGVPVGSANAAPWVKESPRTLTSGVTGSATVFDVVGRPGGFLVDIRDFTTPFGAAQRAYLFAVTRRGRPDMTFGKRGLVRLPSDLALEGKAVTLDRQGRVLVAGGRGVARLLPNGRLDPGFGVGGVARLALTGQRIVAPDGEGNIVLTVDPSGQYEFASGLIRLDVNGRPDQRFGTAGTVTAIAPPPARVAATIGTSAFGTRVSDVASTSRGILISGVAVADGNSVVGILGGLDRNGAPDSAFGTDGFRLLTTGRFVGSLSNTGPARALRVLSGDRFLAIGQGDSRSARAITVERYFANGVKDPTYGIDGYADIRRTILASAHRSCDGGLFVTSSALGRVELIRASGRRDTRFGVNGELVVRGSTAVDPRSCALAIVRPLGAARAGLKVTVEWVRPPKAR